MKNTKPQAEYLWLRLRDKTGIPFSPQKEIAKLNLEEGQIILEYGCGLGSYTLSAAKSVGGKGKVYALDKNPSAIDRVKQRALEEGIHNIETILSDGDTGLSDESVDVVLLYGVLPEIEDKESLLRELYRVLKPSGYLSTRFCFRFKKSRLLEIFRASGIYSLSEQKGHLINFKKQ